MVKKIEIFIYNKYQCANKLLTTHEAMIFIYEWLVKVELSDEINQTLLWKSLASDDYHSTEIDIKLIVEIFECSFIEFKICKEDDLTETLKVYIEN